MDALIQELDIKFRQWQPATVEQVRQCLAEIIELADQDAFDILRSRVVEQEVLDLIDESETW
jgi:predicted ATP-dependent serine protease